METTASTVSEVNRQAPAELVEQLDIDCAFLRHNDHKVRVSKLVAACPPGPVPVLYLDLDRLKSINDYLGHTAGDWFIRTFAEQLQMRAGAKSMIARLGGDEFEVVPDRRCRLRSRKRPLTNCVRRCAIGCPSAVT
jgi:predicted signal transduction protein with EAL and GGDEF domain